MSHPENLYVWVGSPDDTLDVLRYAKASDADVLRHPAAAKVQRAAEHEFNRANALERACRDKDSRLIAEEERRKLTGDALHAEGESARLASLLSSIARTHGCPEGIQKRIRAEGVTQDPSAEWSPYQLRKERDEAGAVLGAVCMVGTLEPDEECESLDTHQHAAVQTAMRIRWERDAVRGALRHAEGEIASLRIVRDAAREYLMRSVPDPNVGTAAEDTLREALADLEMTS